MEKEKNEFEINIKEICGLFLKRWWLIVLCAVLCAVIAFSAVYLFTDKKYKATGHIYVNNSMEIGVTSVSITASDISASSSLTETYSAILSTRTMMENILIQAALDDVYSVSALSSMLSIKAADDTAVLQISVTSNNPEHSQILTNAAITVISVNIPKIIEGSSVVPFDYAITPKTALSRGFTKYSLIGFFAGAVLACLIVFIFDYVINDTIQSSDWLEDTFGESITVLSVVPDTEDHGSTKYGYYYRKYASKTYRESQENEKHA